MKFSSHPSPRRSDGTRQPRAAFTLVELLVVIAIISILLVMIVPASGRIDALTIRGAQELVEAQLTLARQTAISRNLSVEVRVYNTAANGTQPIWNTVALVIPALVSGKGTDEWVANPTAFSSEIVIDPGNSQGGKPFSTLLVASGDSAPTATNPNPTAPWTAKEPVTALAAVRNRQYVAFRFRPDGSTNLPSRASATPLPWCIALKNSHSPRSANDVPAANYAALVLDPMTGRTLSYQP